MIQIFEHSNDTRTPVRLVGPREPHERVADVITVEPDELVFVEGQDEPVEVTTALRALGVDDAVHLHRHRQRRLTVVVTYNGQQIRLEFGPATLIAKVRSKAIKQLHLDVSSSTDLELQLPGTEEGIDESTHLGSLAADDCHTVELMLIPGHRFHG